MGDALTKDYPPKVFAIFESVIALMNEGADIHLLKVADITKKAGIGKGTAYEYFASKEEIIAGALIYDVKLLFESLYELQRVHVGFEEKIWAVLAWIKDDFKKSHAFTRIVAMGAQNKKINYCLQEHLAVSHQAYDEYLAFIDYLLEFAVKQGIVSGDDKFRSRIAISSQIVSLVMYLTDKEMYPGATEQEAMQIAYDNIMLLVDRNKRNK